MDLLKVTVIEESKVMYTTLMDSSMKVNLG